MKQLWYEKPWRKKRDHWYQDHEIRTKNFFGSITLCGEDLKRSCILEIKEINYLDSIHYGVWDDSIDDCQQRSKLVKTLASGDPFWEKPMPLVLIHYDSSTTIAKIENRYYNGKRRQMRRKHNTLRDCISKGAIRVDHVSTYVNLADPLTKELAREKVQNT